MEVEGLASPLHAVAQVRCLDAVLNPQTEGVTVHPLAHAETEVPGADASGRALENADHGRLGNE